MNWKELQWLIIVMLCFNLYLCVVCWLVGWIVSRITQKLLIGFPPNFGGRWVLVQNRSQYLGSGLRDRSRDFFFFFLLSLTSFQKWNTCIHRVLLTATSSVLGLPSRILCFLLYMKNLLNNINSTARPLCTYLQFFKMQVNMQINGNWLLVIMDKQGTKKSSRSYT